MLSLSIFMPGAVLGPNGFQSMGNIDPVDTSYCHSESASWKGNIVRLRPLKIENAKKKWQESLDTGIAASSAGMIFTNQ